ncbi:MAG: hypothetical protein KDI15_07760 [Thiothrix sp.]|nr:hypothetical protein [Thiothrix sp.]HPE60259.1 hypothetical protein [Thiolinea sp.]
MINDLYQQVIQRQDMSSAGLEVIIMLVVAYVLGFLFCYVRARRDEENQP